MVSSERLLLSDGRERLAPEVNASTLFDYLMQYDYLQKT